MRIRRLIAALAVTAALAPAALAKEPLKIYVDQTVTMKLSGAASSVVLGNATVVDVNVHDANTLLITGKAFGTTNMMVLNKADEPILQVQLIVASDNPGELTIVRGTGVNTYSCSDKCRATPMVGDDPGYFNNVMATVNGKQAAAKGN